MPKRLTLWGRILVVVGIVFSKTGVLGGTATYGLVNYHSRQIDRNRVRVNVFGAKTQLFATIRLVTSITSSN